MWFSVFRQSCTESFVMHRSTETNLPPLTPIKTISISYTAWAVYHPVNLTHTFVWIAVTTKWLIERDYKFFTFPLYLLTKELREKNMSFLGGYPPFGPSKGVPQKNWHSWLFMTTIFRQHAASIYGFVHQFVSSKKKLFVRLLGYIVGASPPRVSFHWKTFFTGSLHAAYSALRHF